MSTATATPADQEVPRTRGGSLDRHARECEAAIQNADTERSRQLSRLSECIHREPTFRVKKSSNGRVWIPRRVPTLDGCPEKEWKTGESSFSLHPSDGDEFTAFVTKAGIGHRGRSYLVVGVSATQEIRSKKGLGTGEHLLGRYEYQLFLTDIRVVDGLD